MLRVSWCAALLRSTGEFISGMGGNRRGRIGRCASL